MFQLLNKKFSIDPKQRNLRLRDIQKGHTQNFWNFRLCSYFVYLAPIPRLQGDKY